MDDVGVNGASFDWLAGCARRDASKARILEVTALLIAERGVVEYMCLFDHHSPTSPSLGCCDRMTLSQLSKHCGSRARLICRFISCD